MKLKSVTLNDFRQFYRNQEIVFSTDDTKRITLIHAENSAGKTTLLNAILWCMFGKKYVSDNFAHPDELVNYQALREGRNECEVTVSFTVDFAGRYEPTEYEICRRYDQNQKTDLVVLRFQDPTTREWKQEIGNSENSRRSIQNRMGDLIPPLMLKHFFTAGEAATKQGLDISDFRQSFETLLGTQYIKSAKLHLYTVGNVFESRSIEGQKNAAEFKKITEQQNRLESEIAQIEDRLARLPEKMEEQRKIYDESVQIIAQNDIPKKIQSDIKNKKSRKTEIISELKETENEIKEWVSEEAVSLLFSPMELNSINEYVNTSSAQNNEHIHLKYPFNKTLLDTILKKRICICGTEIHEEQEKHLRAALDEIIQSPEEKEKEAKSGEVKNLAAVLSDLSKKAPENLDNHIRKKFTLLDKITFLNSEIDNLEKELRFHAVIDIREAEARKKEADRLIATYTSSIAENKKVLNQKKEEKIKLETKKKRIKIDDNATSKDSKCAEICRTLFRKCEEIWQKEIPNARDQVQNSMNEILSKLGNGFRVSFDEHNTMSVKTIDGRDYNPGGAEASFIALSFVLSMTDLSRKRCQERNKFLPGLIAPFIHDSTMGVFSENYRNFFWENLPNKAEQMIFMLSSSQIDESTTEILRQKNLIGREYYIKAHQDNLTTPVCETIKGKRVELTVRDRFVHSEFCDISE